MALNDKILSSTLLPGGYSIQPYPAMEAPPIYTQRLYVAIQPVPVVDSALHSTAQVLTTQKPVAMPPVTAPPAMFDMGAAPVRGTMAGVKGGV